MPMTEFARWQQQMGLNDPQTAQLLGLSLQTVRVYRRGERPDQHTPVLPPPAVQERCAALLLADAF